MGQDSNIEWTDATWNPVVGCTRASAGCDNCYAVVMSNRQEAMAKADIEQGRDPGRKANYIGLTVLNGKGDRHFNGTVRTVPEALTGPLHWKRPRKVFVNSMSDLFHKDVPFDFIDKVFAVMALCPQHTFQILTKRPERMAQYTHDRSVGLRSVAKQGNILLLDQGCDEIKAIKLSDPLSNYENPFPNVWLGTSIENQATADERIPHLLRVPAAVRFLSVEPLLGEIDDLNLIDQDAEDHFELIRGPEVTRDFSKPFTHIDWVIVGGESGANARPCNVEWIRSIVGQCKAARVPVFVKQLGGKPYNWLDGMGKPAVGKWYEPTIGDDFDTHFITDRKGATVAEWPEDLRVRELPKGGAA